MAQAYGNWPESIQPGTSDWKKANLITAGVDIGTTSSQAVIFCDHEIFGYANIHTGANFKNVANDVIQLAMGSSGMVLQDIRTIVATGFGGNNTKYATRIVDEIHCHAKGARYMFGPKVTTVADLGGQTMKAIRLYEWDRVRDFIMNDKCATGIGRSIEVTATYFQVPIIELGEKSLEAERDPEPISTTCYNFAMPETIGLLRQGFREEAYSENEVFAAYMLAIAWRILAMIGKLRPPEEVGDVRIYEDLAFTGGLAKNPGITKRIERELKVTALTSDYDPQLAGALGAALLAAE
jgi:benzoyl-CoA reductase subunit A